MITSLTSLSNVPVYTAVKDEDFEETASDDYGSQGTGSVVAAKKPTRSLTAGFLMSPSIIIIHLAWLLLLMFTVVCLRYTTSGITCAQSRLPSDEVFGEIPFRIVNWEQDMAFVNSDPMEGKHWNQTREAGVDSGVHWTAWDDIHPGSWVRMAPSPKLGIAGGIPLREYSQDKSWDTNDEGFAVSMHHQIHCLGMMKHVFMQSERNQIITTQYYRHMDHCVEYLRQAILCHGDLTLEPLLPGKRNTIESDTWGSKHYCRDWNVLKEVLGKITTVGFDQHGFTFDQELA